MIQKGWKCWQTYGAGETLCRTLHRFRLVSASHSLDIFIKTLSPNLPPKRSLARPEVQGMALAFREVGSEEQLPLAEGLDPASIREFFALGSRLFAALADGVVLAVNWVNTRAAHLSYIRMPRVPLPTGIVYLHSSFVAPAYRNQGIGTLLKQYLLGVLQQKGYHLAMLAVFLENTRAVRWHQADGFQHWGRVTYLRYGRRNLWWSRLTKEGQRHPDLLKGGFPR